MEMWTVRISEVLGRGRGGMVFLVTTTLPSYKNDIGKRMGYWVMHTFYHSLLLSGKSTVKVDDDMMDPQK